MPSLLPGNLPLLMRRGVAFGPISIFCKDGLGAVFNLTGYNVFAIARAGLQQTPGYDLTPAIVAPATNGEIKIEFTDEETFRLFPAGEYVYDLILEDSSGDRGGPFISGRLTVEDISSKP